MHRETMPRLWLRSPEKAHRGDKFGVLAGGLAKHLAHRFRIHILERAQPERHRAPAPIAVSFRAENALLFAIAAHIPGSHLRGREAIVRDRPAVLGTEQF